MHPVAKLKTGAAAIVAATAVVAVAGLLFASGARTEELKHYDSSKKDFWLHPPDDWFMGDETQELKGTHVLNTLPPPTGFTDEEVVANLKNVKLPPGFKIELWARVPAARQMAWGDKGTLFVGSWFGVGKVFAVVDEGGKKTVKEAIKGMTVPTGVAFHNGSLYVADVNKIFKYDNAEANLDNMPAGAGRLRRHAALHSARLEISGIRQERLALRGLWSAVQHLPAAHVDVPDPAH